MKTWGACLRRSPTVAPPAMVCPPIHPNEATPRLPPLSTDQLQPQWRETLARIPGAGLKGSGFPSAVLGELMHSPELFGPFLEWWVTAKRAMALSVREQELVILRMAVLYSSDYVWKHHVPVAGEFGVAAKEISALRQGHLEAFGARERALLSLTEAMVCERWVSPDIWAVHGRQLQAQEVVDLIALVAQYVLFALTNNVLQVPLEAPLRDQPGLAEAIGHRDPQRS